MPPDAFSYTLPYDVPSAHSSSGDDGEKESAQHGIACRSVPGSRCASPKSSLWNTFDGVPSVCIAVTESTSTAKEHRYTHTHACGSVTEHNDES